MPIDYRNSFYVGGLYIWTFVRMSKISTFVKIRMNIRSGWLAGFKPNFNAQPSYKVISKL